MIRRPGLLNASLTEIARLEPTAASVTAKMVGAGEATLTLAEDAPAVHVHDWVSMYTRAGFAGYYRVTNVAQTFRRQIDVSLLFGIDILSDSVWPEQTDFSGTKAQFLTQLLDKQTQLINGVKPWQLGTCADTSSIERSINYDRLSTLLEALEVEGSNYYFTYDQTTWPWTINYVAKTNTVTSEFRLTRNVRTATITYNDADLCTRLYLSVSSKNEDTVTVKKKNPLYIDDETTPGVPALVDDNITVSYTDSAVRTYNNNAAQAVWGIVTKTADIDTHDDIAEQHFASADAWAANYLALRAEPSVQIQIDGDVLREITGSSWDETSIGALCQVALPDYGHTFREYVVSITYPDLVKDETHVTVSLANTLPKVSESIATARAEAATASRASRATARASADAKEVTHWSQVVKYQGDALDGTGVLTLYESGIDMDATGGVKIYSLEQGLQGLYSGISVNTAGIELQGQKITSIAVQSGVVTEVFDPTKSYAVGDKVSYEGVGYVFIAAQNGTEQNPIQWTPANVSAIQPLQSQITQEGDKIALVVDSNDKIKAASIILAINQTKDAQSQSSAEITADLIKLNGSTTTINDKLKITDGQFVIDGVNTIIKGTTYSIGMADGNLSARNINVQNGSLAFTTSSGGTTETSTITAAKASKMITDLQLTLSNNTYTLQKKTVDNQNSWTDVGTFSRATTLYQSNYTIGDVQKTAGWSGGIFTVRAEPQLEEATTRLTDITVQSATQGTMVIKNMNVALRVWYDDDGVDKYTGFEKSSLAVDASPVYNSGWGAAYGKVSWPTAQTSNAYMDVAAPPQTVDGAATSKRFYVRSTNNVAYISIANNNETWTDYAAVTHNKYILGQQSVTPTSATISNSVLNSSTNRREATLTVTYKGPDTTASTAPLSNVDVTSIYNAGYADGSTKTTYPVNFTVTFSDGHTGTVSADCANIWNQGADAATPSANTLYAYNASTGNYVNVRSRASSDSAYVVGAITTNTDVTFIRNSSGGGYKYVHISYSNNGGTPGDYWINSNFLSTTNGHYSQYNYLGWYGSGGGGGGDDDKEVDYVEIMTSSSTYHNEEDLSRSLNLWVMVSKGSGTTVTSYSRDQRNYQIIYNAAEQSSPYVTGATHNESLCAVPVQHVIPYKVHYTDGTDSGYRTVVIMSYPN